MSSLIISHKAHCAKIFMDVVIKDVSDMIEKSENTSQSFI